VKLRYVPPTLGIAVLIATFMILVILVLWLAESQVVWLWNAKGVNAKELFEAKNSALATFAQILGGFTLLIGLYFAWQNITASTKNFELTKEGQVTDRFYKAIEQLGATDDKGQPKSLMLCLGGIYALERIAKDSEKDHWQIMEVLTAYVRENAQWKETNEANSRLALDTQTILTVIRRREWSYEKSSQKLDLHQTDLRGADLHETILKGADLSGAHLEGANLKNTHLEGANLCEAHLEGATATFLVSIITRKSPPFIS
jgi:hypothetical protein